MLSLLLLLQQKVRIFEFSAKLSEPRGLVTGLRVLSLLLLLQKCPMSLNFQQRRADPRDSRRVLGVSVNRFKGPSQITVNQKLYIVSRRSAQFSLAQYYEFFIKKSKNRLWFLIFSTWQYVH